ncbi:hypothetical protein ABT013_24420 [Streptomyces bacillaris]|uniref:hypothetical protein n=1 Tax=Streptomyces TaxID=1883 RepID=UPI00036EC60F|nr:MULTISPECIES: hypothetical protein [Streptomyces]MYR38564.1 hypothetical protein [Streptomyces sp. SID4944]MBT3074311.1 hypothetical protein [Streptomyces sp. COG21]MBT3083128.1 hypothetical protein [Streptomyces sp. COG20]MBT3090732.1 hypothetical protein [Streptomyces sp. CYG21]MBT3096109.1 hypothetical protein [Streptomyces sp. CBG30]
MEFAFRATDKQELRSMKPVRVGMKPLRVRVTQVAQVTDGPTVNGRPTRRTVNLAGLERMSQVDAAQIT